MARHPFENQEVCVSNVVYKQRTMEIARLLSGATITDAAVANAKALLSER